MNVISLIENTTHDRNLYAEHGLSLYLETRQHKVLFDTGASGRFADNAGKLGISLAEVDTLILSHGHYDHTGGILRFLEENDRAQVYLSAYDFAPYYHVSDTERRFIGIRDLSPDHPRLTLLQGDLTIDDELTLFTGVTGRKCFPETNFQLKYDNGRELVQDDFRHELYLAVTEGAHRLLLSGCSHNGILNILERYQTLFQREPDVVIGGFHTAGKGDFRPEHAAQVDALAQALRPWHTVFYTCHCTGQIPYQRLHRQLGDRMRYLATGEAAAVPLDKNDSDMLQ